MRFGFVWSTCSVALVLVCLASSHARAGRVCPSMAEVQAEQTLRLHSELMVVGLTCGPYYQEPADIYAEYQRFTAENADMLRTAEAVMQKNLGVRNFHERRTQIANAASQHAARMSPQAYCRMNAAFVGDVLGLTPAQLQWYVSRLAENARAKIRACQK